MSFTTGGVPIAIFDVVLKGGQVAGNKENRSAVKRKRDAYTALIPRVCVNTLQNNGDITRIKKAKSLQVSTKSTLLPATPATPHARVPRRT
jgi:hypothetical protein